MRVSAPCRRCTIRTFLPITTTRFRRRVSKAIMSARKILDTTRKPTYADEIPHLYDDKYSLSEFLTATSLAALSLTLLFIAV